MQFKKPKSFKFPAIKKGKAPKKTAMTLKDAAATAKALDELNDENYGEMKFQEHRGRKGYGR
jgi:hypothetical protein